MSPAPCPTKARRDRRPFPYRDLRELQEFGPEALRTFLEANWRPVEPKRRAA